MIDYIPYTIYTQNKAWANVQRLKTTNKTVDKFVCQL